MGEVAENDVPPALPRRIKKLLPEKVSGFGGWAEVRKFKKQRVVLWQMVRDPGVIDLYPIGKEKNGQFGIPNGNHHLARIRGKGRLCVHLSPCQQSGASYCY